MKEESTAQTSLVKNKWDKKKNGTNIYTNPKLCFLNYRGCRNTSKIPLAIIHLSFILAAFQVQSPQRFQWNLLTSWVRTMWLYSIKRIQNLILQHLSWKKKKKIHPSWDTNTGLYQYLYCSRRCQQLFLKEKGKHGEWRVIPSDFPDLSCFSSA